VETVEYNVFFLFFHLIEVEKIVDNGGKRVNNRKVLWKTCPQYNL
jgi:hypothetical protein